MRWFRVRFDAYRAKLRRKRFLALMAALPQGESTLRILDVGGEPAYWDMIDAWDNPYGATFEITSLNLTRHISRRPEVTCIEGDARDLSRFADKSYDLVFSNSVIEHVGTIDDQKLMASEVRRVGQSYYVQTPNYWFPIEPHFFFPGLQFLPLSWRAEIHHRIRLGWNPAQKDRALALATMAQIRLMSEDELRVIFPDAAIWHEKMGGLTKSLIACRMEPAIANRLQQAA